MSIRPTMKIHSNDVVCARAGEQISNQRAGLGHPRAVSNLRLEGRRLRSRRPRYAVHDRAAARAIKVGRLLRPVRLGVDCVAALDTVGLGGAGRIRRGRATVALVQLHPAERVVQVGRAIAEPGTLGLPGVGRLWPRVEGECAGPRARARRRLGEGRARLVVRDVRLARVGEEGQDGGDALG